MLTRKQKLVLKSSKVFIKFKSGVFICNSCTISGWKLNFWPSWRVVKIDVNWMISGWIMNILTQKLEFKKLSLIQVFSPRFYPVCDLVKTGIKKIEFKLCNQISPSWWMDFKSGVKVKFKWSSKVEFWNPSF